MNTEFKLLEKNIQAPPETSIITPIMLQTATSLSRDKESIIFTAFFNTIINMIIPHFVEVSLVYTTTHTGYIEALSGKVEAFNADIAKEEAKKLVHNFVSNFRPNQTKSYLEQVKLMRKIVHTLFNGLEEAKKEYEYDELLGLIDDMEKTLNTLLNREFQLAAIIAKSYMIFDFISDDSKGDVVFAALKRLSEKIGEWAKSAGYTLAGNHQVEGDFEGFDEFIDKVNDKLQSVTNLSNDKLHLVSVESADDDFSFNVNIIFDSDDQDAANKLVMWYYVDTITEFGTSLGADMS